MRKLLFAAVAAVATMATPAAAVQIATISNTSGNNVRFVKAGALNGRLVSGTATTASWTNVFFRFEDSRLAAALGTFTAQMNMNLIANTAATLNGTLRVQNFSSGTLAFRTVAPITIGSTYFATGANLMSFAFGSGAQLAGLGRTASVLISSSAGLAFTSLSSDFLDFGNSTNQDISLSVTGLGSNLGFTSGQVLNGFTGVAGGTVDADPVPQVIPGIPEPQVWMTMVLGFMAAGLVFRSRRTNVVSA